MPGLSSIRTSKMTVTDAMRAKKRIVAIIVPEDIIRDG